MQFLIRGIVYHGIVKRVKGKLKIFFKTDGRYRIQNGYELPDFCCSKMTCKCRNFREWKDDLITGRLSDFVIYP